MKNNVALQRAVHKILFAKAGLTAGALLVGTAAIGQTAPATGMPASTPGPLDEIIVTASRRRQDVIDIPYNVSAYGADQLAQSRVTSVADLSYLVPNFVVQDQGARYAAEAVPIIRGLNASAPVTRRVTEGQSPVAYYLGDSPSPISFPIDDIERVEVLRGPQGTLYGAGSLGGAVRLIPSEPKLVAWEGKVGGSASSLAHSSDAGYGGSGLLNVPLGSSFAARGSFSYRKDPGFIDQFGIMQRQSNNYVTGVPVLADPADVANSSAVYFNKKDVNDAENYNGRLSALWVPTGEWKLVAGFNYSRVTGNGGPTDNPYYKGGASPTDPRITFPATGNYQIVADTLEPYSRTSKLSTLDASYDAGFATLSSTSSYFETEATNNSFESQVIENSAALRPYYIGTPINPRFIAGYSAPDQQHSVTEELRLVSKTGGSIDYTLGAYYQKEVRNLNLIIHDVGAADQSSAANGGSTVPFILGGTYVPTLSDGTSFAQTDRQHFTDKSLFGELTYHVTPKWQVTAGGRYFWQDFRADVANNAVIFLAADTASNATSVHDGIYKFNSSYDYLPTHRVYATASEGFRRGGANAFPLTGIELEPSQLLAYKPDKTNNYEIGLKGRFDNGTNYTLDAFYIDWQKPQIATATPSNLWPVVVNAPKAKSQGLEVEASGPAGVPGLSYVLGAAYVDATLTQAFCLPAGNAFGGVIPCNGSLAGTINAPSGTRLPGSPKASASGTLTYTHTPWINTRMSYSLNANYRSAISNALASQTQTVAELPSYTLVNASVTADHGPWQVQGYVHNAADKRAVFGGTVPSASGSAFSGELGHSNVISQPREIGFQLSYRWE